MMTLLALDADLGPFKS